MTFRAVLTVLRGGKADAPCLEAAYRMARPFDGHIDALHVRTDPQRYLDFTGDGMTGDTYAQLIDSLEQEIAENARKARASFDAWLAEVGAKLVDGPGPSDRVTASWHEQTGGEERIVGERGRLYDLVDLASGAVEDGSERLNTIETAIFDTGRPLLLVSAACRLTGLDRIAVLWNGSAQAARAVEAALPVLRHADAVDVMWVEEDVADDAIQTGVIEYLAWHDIAASAKRLTPDRRFIGEMLLDEATADGANLLVMGGYSHSRLREFILGGVTQHMLENGTLPVFVAH